MMIRHCVFIPRLMKLRNSNFPNPIRQGEKKSNKAIKKKSSDALKLAE